MSKPPNVSGKKCINAFQKIGFILRRQKGSHIILRKENPFAQIVIPNHKVLDKGTLRAIIRQADLSVSDFLKLL